MAGTSCGVTGALLTTGQVARKLKVTLQTLHFYEEQGLVQPARRDGRRLYDAEALSRLAFVVDRRRDGLSLKHIAQLLGDARLRLEAVS